MDAIQTIKAEIDKFLSSNSLYNTYKKQWRYLLESFVGGDEYRRAGHLVRYQLETDAEYYNRLQTTPLQNHCASVISVYNSFLFREPPQREFGSIKNLPELQQFLTDSDLDGRSFDAFMRDVATYNSTFGHTWIMVVKPNVGAATRADEIAAGVRPYVSLLTPLTVLDWEWHRNPNGRYELKYFKYVEEVNGDVSVVKEWTPETITTAIIDEERITLEKTVEPNGLGKIPAVISYNKRSIMRGIGVSDISDISDAQRFIYNATSEIDQSIRMDTHPSLVKTPDTLAGTGSGAIIHMPDNLDPALKPYLLEYSGAAVDKILATIRETIGSIDKMANTGAVRATESRTVSGIALETEFSLLNARLSEKGDSLELTEEHIWSLWAEYQGSIWDGIVTYPDSFNIRDARVDLDMYLKAQTATVQSQTFSKELQKEIARVAIGADDVLQAQIAAEIDAAPTGDLSDIAELYQDSESEDLSAERTYENGEPIDPRLPPAYRNATGEPQQCENCVFYNPETFVCELFGNAAVRPMWVCAKWQGIE